MTGQQQAVMWLGITLIVMRLFSTGQWQALWGTVAPAAPATKGGGIGGCPKGQIMVDGKCLLQEAAATVPHPSASYPNSAIPT